MSPSDILAALSVKKTDDCNLQAIYSSLAYVWLKILNLLKTSNTSSVVTNLHEGKKFDIIRTNIHADSSLLKSSILNGVFTLRLKPLLQMHMPRFLNR